MVLFREFEIKTGGRLDALDVTEELIDVVSASGVSEGNALVFSPHTTCCVLVTAHDAPTLAALERTIDALVPLDRYYAHDDLTVRTENLTEDELPNARAHIAHAFLGKASECLPIVRGGVLLGETQRVLFIELDSSRARRYCIQVVGE